MTKRQLDRIARIYAGSILACVDGDFTDLPEPELNYILKAVHKRGKKICGNDQEFPDIRSIISYVRTK